MLLAALYSLAHVEGEVDVLLLGEQQNEKVITCLALFDGRVQTDLVRQKKESTVRKCAKMLQKNIGKLRNQIITTKNICL